MAEVDINIETAVLASDVVPKLGAGETANSETEDDSVEEHEGGENVETAGEQPLDDDLDRRNPQYIPKGGAFYEHDNRTADDIPPEDAAEAEKKKKVWKESKNQERWLHDCYVEEEQCPKTAEELIEFYGYDIRNEENAPRARRRRRYGRGPDKYERKWDDEEAYSQKGIKGRPAIRKKSEDFPPLPNQKNGHLESSSTVKPASNTSWRSSDAKPEPRAPARGPLPPKSSPPRAQEATKPRFEDNIKPFRNDPNKSHGGAPPRGKNSDGKQSTPGSQSYRDVEIQGLTDSMGKISVQQTARTLVPGAREKEPAPEVSQNQASRQNPKRYSKISKGFYFPPEEAVDLNPQQLKQANMGLHPSMPQPAVVPSVFKRYEYNNNGAYLPGRTILQPQATIPATLSPQMAGIDMSHASHAHAGHASHTNHAHPTQPTYVPPPPLYIDMGQGEVVPFQGYPYAQTQSADLYTPSGQAMPSGITYYSPEVQTGAGQPRALPQRRKVAIPIVPPPEQR